ncbi:MAG TPA: ribonuclease R [Longimicrobiales bacterium]|nr:ribonuclease R [Longimicrobiales bacterium]
MDAPVVTRRTELEAAVVEALAASRRGPLKPKELARELRVAPEDYRPFKDLLGGLERAGRIYRVKGNRYGLPGSMDLAVGRASLTRTGDAFVRPEEGGGDVYVPSLNLSSALDGDRVVVRIESRPAGRSPVGRVIKVLERARATVVGTFHPARRFAYVVPLDRRMTKNVLIPPDGEGGAKDGDVVVVRIVSYGEGSVGPAGEVEHVLGRLADPGVDILAVAHGYGLALEFPREVTVAAEASAQEGMKDQGADRVDRTDLLVVTVDPADAKDHDDALSVEPLADGRWEVGIHIADVGHFVPEGGPVDEEARSRGTSVYLVDRVIPMLPERLSGDICSLREGVERLAVSAFLTVDAAGAVHAQRFQRTRIRSRRRLSYEQVQEMLDGLATLGDGVDEALRTLDDLARGLRRRRAERGALDLDLPEARVLLDADGIPLDIQRVVRLEAHRLIEDWMIAANEAVARACEARGLPALYRVHEPPVRERTEELREFLSTMGLKLPGRKTLKPADLQHLLDRVRGRPEEHLVSTVTLRSLQRARYDAENLGHFGLASTAYLHFTSPIRRYPDLVVHREVTRTLVLGAPPRERDPDELESVADQASAREQAAAEAERDSVALKKVEFMERHLGHEFDGRISGVAAFGFFVTLDAYFVDGLVHVNSLRDDFYRLTEGTYALVGDRGRRRYRLGDRVRVQVARVDKEDRHVDFLLVRKLSQASV